MEKRQVTLEEWKKNRQRNFISYCIFSITIGMECGLVPPTVLGYLQEGLHAENPEIWLGLIIGSYFVTSLIGCLNLTRYTDRTRNVKKTLVICSSFVAFASFIYAIPSYAFVLLIARLIQGFADSLMAIIQGEIIRCYENTEQTKKLSIITVLYFGAFMGGPVFATIFSGVDFTIFDARFKVYNFPFLMVGFLWISFVLVAMFFVTDLSKEIVYSARNSSPEDEINTSIPLSDENGCRKTEAHLRKQTKRNIHGKASTILFTNPRVNFILLLTFICGYFAACFNYVRMPTISTDLYHIPAQYLGMIYNLECIVFFVTSYLINKLKLVNIEIYCIVFIKCVMIVGLQAMVLSALFYQYRPMGVCFLLTFAVCLGIGWSSEQIFIVTLLGRMVPNEIQGYAAGVKRTMINLSFILGSFTTPFLRGFIFEHIFVLSVCMFVLIAIALYFREKFT